MDRGVPNHQVSHHQDFGGARSVFRGSAAGREDPLVGRPNLGATFMTTVADQFAEVLAAAGVKRIYGIVGDSLNGLTDAIRRQGKIEWVHVRHEEVAAFAAGGEAHVSFWPYLIPFVITIDEAAAPPSSLMFMFCGGAVVFPLMLLYTLISYSVLRGKVATTAARY